MHWDRRDGMKDSFYADSSGGWEYSFYAFYVKLSLSMACEKSCGRWFWPLSGTCTMHHAHSKPTDLEFVETDNGLTTKLPIMTKMTNNMIQNDSI